MRLPETLQKLIRAGENISVEFKRSRTDITKDVYETVCAFSNRDGGHIFLGVKDDGTVAGVEPDRIMQIKKDFVTTINNESKMFPPLYLTPEEYEEDGKTILYIYVPSGKTVYRSAGRISTAITTPISISPTTLIWFLSFMRESKTLIS